MAWRTSRDSHYIIGRLAAEVLHLVRSPGLPGAHHRTVPDCQPREAIRVTSAGARSGMFRRMADASANLPERRVPVSSRETPWSRR
jgi:hypothetical protein